MIKNDTDQLLKQEHSIVVQIYMFLEETNIDDKEDRINYISDVLIGSMTDKTDYELYSDTGKILQTHYMNFGAREDLDYAKVSGKNYIFKKLNNRYFIIVSNAFVIEEETYLISLIKDVSYIMTSRRSQYTFFILLSSVIILLSGLASFIATKFITKDISVLTKVTSSIKEGHYGERTGFEGPDEIRLIGRHIDEMATELEDQMVSLHHETLNKQRFIDNITHELKTPLTSIVGYSDMLRKMKYEKDSFDKGLYHIYEEGNRLTRLIQQMKDMILTQSIDLDLKDVI